MVLVLAATSSAEDWYVSPEGKPANSGRRESPWDIASALGAHQKVAPGDTVYLLPGTHRRRPEADFEIRLVGTADRPIHVRSVPSLPRSSPGGRATIDGGLVVRDPSAHVWVRDLEILVSENFSMPRELNEPPSRRVSDSLMRILVQTQLIALNGCWDPGPGRSSSRTSSRRLTVFKRNLNPAQWPQMWAVAEGWP